MAGAVELEADHRRRLHRRAIGPRQVVQARFEQRLDRRRHDDLAVGVAAHPVPSPSWRSAPLSISIDSICSTYSGLPSAAVTMRSTTSCGSPAEPSRLATTCADGGVAQRAQAPGGRPVAFAPLRLGFEQIVARRGQQQDRRRPCEASSMCSSRSRNAGSAQWMSSTTRDHRAVARRSPRGTCAHPSRARAAGSAAALRPTALASRAATSASPTACQQLGAGGLGVVVVADVRPPRAPCPPAARR